MLIRKTLFVAMLLVLGMMTISLGCGSYDFLMAEEDKQPRMEVFAYDAAGNLLSDPIIEYIDLYKVGQDILICDQPTGQIRFDVYVESWDVNQAFTIEVVFPDDDIEYMQHFDPEERPSVAKWPQSSVRMPIAWETIPLTFTSDNGRGPGGYFTVTVATWAPKAGQIYFWAPKYDQSFFLWDEDDPTFVRPQISFILTDSAGRKVVRKLGLWVNIVDLSNHCG